jgi:hypothetical protein
LRGRVSRFSLDALVNIATAIGCRVHLELEAAWRRELGGWPMKIDIDRLTEAELVDLNRRIVERLRLLQQMQAHVRMLEFKVGERVQFQPAGHPPVAGVLTRYNRKTVTVIADTGQQWNVAPQLLQQVDRSASAGDPKPNVIPMPRRPG